MSQNAAPISPLLKASRIIGLAAAILFIIFQAVLVYAILRSGIGIMKETYLEVAVMIMMAILAVWGSLKFKPIPLFIAFIVSFLPSGLYLASIPIVPILFWATTICNLLYLVAGLIILIQKKEFEAARIIGLAAAILFIIFQAVLVYVILYSGIVIMKETYLEVAVMIMMAILAVWGSLKFKPIPLFIAFIVSFSYPVHYVASAHIISIAYRVTHLCSLLYLIGGLIIFIQKKEIEAARIIGLVAAILTIVLYGVMLFANPYSAIVPSEGTYRVVAQIVIMALLAVWGSLKLKPILLFIAFLGSFFPMGFYLLGTPSIFKLIGICNLLYLVAGVIMFIQQRKK